MPRIGFRSRRRSGFLSGRSALISCGMRRLGVPSSRLTRSLRTSRRMIRDPRRMIVSCDISPFHSPCLPSLCPSHPNSLSIRLNLHCPLFHQLYHTHTHTHTHILSHPFSHTYSHPHAHRTLLASLRPILRRRRPRLEAVPLGLRRTPRD